MQFSLQALKKLRKSSAQSLYRSSCSLFLVLGAIAIRKKLVVNLVFFIVLIVSLTSFYVHSDAFSLTTSENDLEDEQFIATRTSEIEEPLELSLQERERQIDELKITLGASAQLPDTTIIEVNSKGQPLTKAEYILCRKTKMKIDAKIITLNNVASGLQEKCIDILHYQEPDYAAIRRAQEAEEQQKIEEYYASYNNFKSLDFEEVETLEVTKEAKEHDISGYIFNNKKYVVDIITCEESHGGCYLKINGRNTGLLQISSPYLFGNNKEYALEIKSIEYNVCGKRFCDYGYDTYDVVNYKIVKGNVE